MNYLKRLEAFWEEQAKRPGLQAVIDPNDTHGIKNAYIDAIHKSVIEKYAKFADMRILDFGCGYGRISRWLIQKGAKSVVGIDLSEEMIKRAKREGETANLCFVYGNIFDDVVEGTFDTLICIWVLQHIVDDEYLQNVLQRLKTLLNPSGQAVFIERVRSQNTDELEAGMPDYYIRRRTLDEYRSLFNNVGFSLRRWQPLRSDSQNRLVGLAKKLTREKVQFFDYVAKLDLWIRKGQREFSWADVIFDCTNE